MQRDPAGRSPAPRIVYEESVYVWPCRHQREQVAVCQIYRPGKIDVDVTEIDKCHARADVVEGKSILGSVVGTTDDEGRPRATDPDANEGIGCAHISNCRYV